MELIYWGELDAATDTTMAYTVNTPGTSTRDAIIALITPVAAGIIASNPTLIAAVEALLDDALTAKLSLTKSVYLDGGKWAWRVSGSPAATHYVLPDHTGAQIVRPTPFPTPAATPAFNW